MSTLTTEQRLDRLESIEAIKHLKAEYCSYCDQGYPPDKLGPLFTEDAVWNGGRFGRHEGRKAIESFFAGASKDIVFAAHLALNPMIEVAGDSASGKWRLLMPSTFSTESGHEDQWLLGDYHERYVRQEGRWLFSNIDLHVNFVAPHAEGWLGRSSVRA